MRLRNEPFPNRIEDDFCSIVQIQLLHEIPSMGLDGCQPQIEQGRHFFVRATLGQLAGWFLSFDLCTVFSWCDREARCRSHEIG